jgi:cellulose synthase/poly-beta-1,6-N-acetylglucosamine synthase-like glycosyltransferase
MIVLTAQLVMTLLLTYIAFATIYLLFLAAAYFLVPEPRKAVSEKINTFAVLIPAHNEELLISQLCESLLNVDYPKDAYQVFVIADNCSDRTAEICRGFPVAVLVRDDPDLPGKGYAIHWALEQIELEDFDAVFMVDADNRVDSQVLRELNNSINNGEVAIQCFNGVGNRSASWFTQLLYVARVIGNHLYHHSKYKLGLSSYLMGNGLCFTSPLLQKTGWTAFSIGEDWEFYGQLVRQGIRVSFAVNSRVYHVESMSLAQATSQRFRWASGKFNVFKSWGFKLMWLGVRSRDWFLMDASLPLVLPNYSLLVNMTLAAFFFSLFVPGPGFQTAATASSLVLLGGQIALFLAGIYLAGDYPAVFKAVLRAPFFLVWKSVIDFCSFSGIHRPGKWIRTARHLPGSKRTAKWR